MLVSERFMDEPEHVNPTTIAGSDLVARIRGGDDAAFEQVFREYTAPCLHFAQSIVGDPDVAEDIVQDVFGWIWLHRTEWAPTTKILPYLLGAVRNRAFDRQRSEKIRSRVLAHHLATGVSPGMGHDGGPADAGVDERDRQRGVYKLLSTLPDHQRMLLFLRWQQGLAWADVASVLGLKVDAVMKQHSRLLLLLRDRLPTIFE
jgi:RNA polymerase sigma-70 factor (ECF subfamily)